MSPPGLVSRGNQDIWRITGVFEKKAASPDISEVGDGYPNGHLITTFFGKPIER